MFGLVAECLFTVFVANGGGNGDEGWERNRIPRIFVNELFLRREGMGRTSSTQIY